MGKIYQVNVVGIKDERKTIDVASSEADFNSMTIKSFKQKLEEKFPELKGQQYRTMFTDVQLEDDDGTFSTYQIQDKSTIMLILRLPGGFYM